MEKEKKGHTPSEITDAANQVKIVAEMSTDEEMREGLEEQKMNDGYPGSCGGV